MLENLQELVETSFGMWSRRAKMYTSIMAFFALFTCVLVHAAFGFSQLFVAGCV